MYDRLCKIELWDTSYDHLWGPSGSEVNRKWNARDLQAQGACALRSLFSGQQGIINHNEPNT